jgi:signal transduction histidine kinase
LASTEIGRLTACLALQQATQSAKVGMVVAAILAGIVLHDIGWLPALGWAAAVTFWLFVRNAWLRRALARLAAGRSEAEAWPAYYASTLLLALLLAVLAPATFGELGLEARLLLTLMLCCWTAAAMGSLSVVPNLYAAYLVVVDGGLALTWAATGSGRAMYVALALVPFGLVLYIFSRSLSARVIESIAIRHENEALVRQLQAANEAKTRFLLAASHDLRQPLHAIGLLGGGLMRLEDEQGMRDASRALVESVNGLNKLFSSILDISRIDGGDLKFTLMPVSIDRLITQLDAEYRAQCVSDGRKWECEVESAQVVTDPVQLERLLRNLLDNAIKHGGRGAVKLSVSRVGSQVQIVVADTGPGIAQADRERVFDEFYRAARSHGEPGLGLGLSIVKRLVQCLDCGLELSYTDPQARRGACMKLLLTAATGAVAEPISDEPEIDIGGMAVLVLDNDPAVLQATQLLLRSWGCRAATCQHPDALEAAVSELGQPEIALVDYRLEDGKIGVKVIEAYQRRYPEMGIIVVTGESDPSELERMKEYGLVLKKPVEPQRLRAALSGMRSAGE